MMQISFLAARRLKVWGYLILFVGSIVLTADTAMCSRNASSISIGGLWDLTGNTSREGQAAYRAARKAVECLNSQGGVHGRPVNLVVADTGDEPGRLLREARRLITQEKVLALLGPTNEFMIPVLRSYARSYQVPVILTAGDDPLLCTEENKSISWIFSVSPNLGSEIKALFQGLTTLDLEPIAPLLADDVTGNKISLWIQGYGLEYHLRILPFQNFGLHDTDVIAQLDHFKGQGARVIVVWGPRNCASMLLHSAMTTGINMVVPVQLITSDMLKKYNGSIRLLTAAPPLLLGRHISLSHPCSFAVHRFIKAMEKEVSEFSVEQFLAGGKAWDAVHLAVMGVRESKTARGSDLGEALENLDQGYYGVMGIFKPTKSDHSGLLPHSLVVVERGKNSWIPVISSNR